MSQLDLSTMSDTELNRIASPIPSSVLNAHHTRSYLKLAPLLSERAKRGITQNKFIKTTNDELGDLTNPEEQTYLRKVNQQGRLQTVWKVKYANSDHELLWQTFLVNEYNEIKLDGILFT